MISGLLRIVAPFLSLAVIAGLAWFVVFQPISAWAASQITERDMLREQRARLQQSVQRLEVERNDFEVTDTGKLTWASQQIGQTTARVQQAINEIAIDQGIRMRSVAPGRSAIPEITEAIGFRLEFEAHLDQLTAFLRIVEANEPILVVAQTKLRRLARQSLENAQPLVFIQMDVVAPIQSSEPSESQ